MPMRNTRTRRSRSQSHGSELDWFAEDPWADPDRASSEESSDDWEAELMAEDDDSLIDGFWADEDGEPEADLDDWGPIQRRRTRKRDYE